MVWQATQAFLALLNTAWPRRISPSFRPASSSSRRAFCFSAFTSRRAYSFSASFWISGENFFSRGLTISTRRLERAGAAARPASRALPTLSSVDWVNASSRRLTSIGPIFLNDFARVMSCSELSLARARTSAARVRLASGCSRSRWELTKAMSGPSISVKLPGTAASA